MATGGAGASGAEPKKAKMADSTDDSTDQTIFRNLEGGESEAEVTEIESLCMNCQKQGVTKLLLTLIPHYREVIISSFNCEHCGHKTTGMESAGRIQDRGVTYTLSVHSVQDLDRQLVKSEHACISIPHLDFEQPPSSSKNGEVNTVEGIISSVAEGLQYFQPQRQLSDPATASKIEDFILKLKKLLEVEEPFDLVLDDISGNSFIENPHAPAKDNALKVKRYQRTRAQNDRLGLQGEDAEDATMATEDEAVEDDTDFKKEVLQFHCNCPGCGGPCDTNMKMADIPFFKEVVIMATNCDRCGYRDNEVKGGSGIEDKGTVIKLKITDPSDLNRDVLKSDTCGMSIPELELDLQHGTLGGRFTTIEGLLKQVKEQLGSWNPFIVGDTASDNMQGKLVEFVTRLDKVLNGEMMNVHFILDDPAGNSYIQNVYAPDPDPEMSVTHYERDYEQREMLGLNDMNTDNYDDGGAS